MVKVRLQGTAQEIEWVKSLFDKLVEETDLKRQNVSVLFENVGTRKYYRCYEEFARKDNTEE